MQKYGVIHICFADDLLMFCRVYLPFIKLVEQEFMKFSKASGLQANVDKSSIYLAGISATFKEDILHEFGYNEGTLPFRYFGIPLASRKLSILQCWPLVEKITAKINCWTLKMLSYSGRLQLIKSVIFRVQSYWTQIFLLPKKVLKMIKDICRTFLWTGTSAISRKALVSWEKICIPQAIGDLNVINLYHWNKASVAKHLWAITKKKDRIFVDKMDSCLLH